MPTRTVQPTRLKSAPAARRRRHADRDGSVGVCGLEVEYGVHAPNVVDPARRVVRAADVAAFSTYTANGGRLYVDVGDHPEWATPECLDARTAVAYDVAGQQLLADAAAAVSDETGAKVALLRNNTDTTGFTYGSHENVQVPRHLGGAEFLEFAARIASFVVSRTVLVGAGRVARTASGWTYRIAQRAGAVEHAVSGGATSAKPIVSTRDEPHGHHRWRRLHVVGADTAVCQTATWLRIGTLRLVAQALLAHPRLLDDLQLADPVEAFEVVAGDRRLRRRLPLQSGRKMTALQLQAETSNRVADLLDRRDGPAAADDRDVLARWRELVDAARQDGLSALETTTDWVAKLGLIDTLLARHGGGYGSTRARGADLLYHDIVDGLAVRLERAGRLTTVVTPHEVAAAMAAPPSTRAAVRGEFVAAVAHGRVDRRFASCSWDQIGMGRPPLQIQLRLSDPSEDDFHPLDLAFEQLRRQGG